MNNGLIINRELPEIARIIEAETQTQKRRRGANVSPHDRIVQLSVADKILDGLGSRLRAKYARQADDIAARDKRRDARRKG